MCAGAMAFDGDFKQHMQLAYAPQRDSPVIEAPMRSESRQTIISTDSLPSQQLLHGEYGLHLQAAVSRLPL